LPITADVCWIDACAKVVAQDVAQVINHPIGALASASPIFGSLLARG
jgi:hypothetical protein